jgi:AdoMet-dependent heme synthase
MMTDTARVPVPGQPAHIELERLFSVWFQVTGLLCNLKCAHCLVDSSPGNTSMPFLDRATVQTYLHEAESMGVKEVYFTGGEPFLHPELPTLLADALGVAPTTVLTNGTLISPSMAQTLRRVSDGSPYSLEIRVSMDHPNEAQNDRLRGRGSHAKALRALLRLQEAGLLPIVTVTEYLQNGPSLFEDFLAMLKREGVQKPRLKILPVFHTGKLESPQTGGVVTQAMMSGVDPLFLQCAQTRVIAADGVYSCPILVGEKKGFLGPGSLRERPGVDLAHHACRTCYETGMSCTNT